ncbi:hypothetical protein bcgnr5373_07200 [Bacillus cereus]
MLYYQGNYSQSLNVLKRIKKIYGLNPTEFAVLELLYRKADQPIKKWGTKYYLQVVVSRM